MIAKQVSKYEKEEIVVKYEGNNYICNVDAYIVLIKILKTCFVTTDYCNIVIGAGEKFISVENKVDDLFNEIAVRHDDDAHKDYSTIDRLINLILFNEKIFRSAIDHTEFNINLFKKKKSFFQFIDGRKKSQHICIKFGHYNNIAVSYANGSFLETKLNNKYNEQYATMYPEYDLGNSSFYFTDSHHKLYHIGVHRISIGDWDDYTIEDIIVKINKIMLKQIAYYEEGF